jgi:NADPH-dependent glutamate synthase beta subunit-like oxidoreductase/NAD(P)H-flavin reductase
MTSVAETPSDPVVGSDSAAAPAALRLGFRLSFEDLYRREGLVRLDALFIEQLAASHGDLHHRLMAARAAPDMMPAKEHSELIVDLAPQVEDFIASLFDIHADVAALSSRHAELAPIYSVKRLFVQRRAVKQFTADEAEQFNGELLGRELEASLGGNLSELRFAQCVESWMNAPEKHAAALDLAARYAAWATVTKNGQKKHRAGVLFKVPHKIDPARLVPVETHVVAGVTMLRLPPERWRERDGFALTDPGTDLTGALDHANYCIWCHNQDKDSCSQGLREKGGAFKKSALGPTLAGCPLEEKISEMNAVKAAGHAIGALAIVTIDNPLCAATGHRICNDCMKSCIFQKQEPVDIPQVETRVLKDVLALPWGFEIYSLLTRWNPLYFCRPLPKPPSGRTVLIVGLGPAGFTLAHHLMNDGHTVVGIDGLKIEPLPPDISGIDRRGRRHAFRPIRRIEELRESLDTRVMAGFGGVAEYGITVRWDKNNLKLVRLLLERRQEFKMFGGVRFGGTITPENAFELGFDHIALCMGAGRPSIATMKNGLAPGVRQASDFLMALQLTGAARSDSVANLQARLPIVVIGGGLTAIDCATEAIAYYPVQVEKFLSRYEALASERGEAALRADWNPKDLAIADEFIADARALRAERSAAEREKRPCRIGKLLRSWGGVTIVYRRCLVDAPSYSLNHEEVEKAMQEGVYLAEGLTPTEVELDAFGHARALRCRRVPPLAATADQTMPSVEDEVVLAARTILVAAGTQPNTVLAREYPEEIKLDGRYFRAIDERGCPVAPERIAKPTAAQVLMELRADGRAMSFFGDLHPSFAGNVVKAMASAKLGHPAISRVLARRTTDAVPPEALFAKLDSELRANVHDIIRLTPSIVEVIVRAPLAAREFRPGQFFRLQNYETSAARVDQTRLAMEGIALTGAAVDRSRGLLSLIVLEMGGSSDLCTTLRQGDPVILMGPTGTATEIPEGKTILLIGGGLGNAVLFSIGQAARARGSRVLYFAGYKRAIDRCKIEEIERASDAIVWCCDEVPGLTPGRPQDKAFVGNIVAALDAYGRNELGSPAIGLSEADRIIAIGSDGMMAAIAAARRTVLAQHLKPTHTAIGSINSPMQCMMKEICAQCLQRHVDLNTGVETIVFSCANQDQKLDEVDFSNLRARLSQNSAQERLTRSWIDHCLLLSGQRGKTLSPN